MNLACCAQYIFERRCARLYAQLHTPYDDVVVKSKAHLARINRVYPLVRKRRKCTELYAQTHTNTHIKIKFNQFSLTIIIIKKRTEKHPNKI